MTQLDRAIGRARSAPVFVAYVMPRQREHRWQRWFAYAPSVRNGSPVAYGLTSRGAERRVRRRLVEHYFIGYGA